MTPEGYVKSAIAELLKVKRIRFFRLNAGSIRIPGSGGKRDRMVRLADAGTPDFLALIPCNCWEDGHRHMRLLYVEAKAATGSQTEAQKGFEKQALAEGSEYVVARSVDDVLRRLR